MPGFLSYGRPPARLAAVIVVASVACGCGAQSPIHHRTTAPRNTTTTPSSYVLKYGQVASVEYQPGLVPEVPPNYKLRITVLGIARGAATPAAEGLPYYLRYRITNLGRNLPATAAYLLAPEPNSNHGAVIIGGCMGSGCGIASGPCPPTPPPDPFPRGKTWTSCSTYYLPKAPSGAVYRSNIEQLSAATVTWN